jgi:ABC-2 type transport system permease protein
MVTGYLNNQPQTNFFPWMFYPVVIPDGDHPIVKNMDAILTLFASSIDTVANKGIKKTILMHSSPESRVVYSPALISLRLLKMQPQKSYFSKPNQAMAVLLEGEFQSVFENRMAPETMQVMDSLHIQFKAKSDANKMVVIADGDLIKNPLGKKGMDYPCGYYPFTKQTFSNKLFLLNAVEFLTDEQGVIAARGKEVRLRLLDRTKVKEEKGKWRLINLALPIILLLVAGLLIHFLRERKYR